MPISTQRLQSNLNIFRRDIIARFFIFTDFSLKIPIERFRAFSTLFRFQFRHISATVLTLYRPTFRSSVDLSPQLSLYSNITAFCHYSSKWNSCRGIMGQRYQIRSTNIISDYTAANGGRFTMFPVMPPVCALNRNAQAPDTASADIRAEHRESVWFPIAFDCPPIAIAGKVRSKAERTIDRAERVESLVFPTLCNHIATTCERILCP